ncbi:nucleotidyltransferase family protein [Ammoniphilus sp. CFH 90114]|uniref:nucleotidyltransferase family protein n=1 Tax=Ammoniphilus sp. CFH 90114 TaxID=2493665 RepID=UPI001F0C7B8A|nr:nucleotidyltransferase domain-containing protein [Ammoniphilus sp. CFH 90114]
MVHAEGRLNREMLLDQVKDIVVQAAQDYPVSVYLFGSWARNEEKRSSDIDIAIDSEEEGISPSLLNTLRDAVEESLIPYRVDIVDLVKADPAIRQKVQKEGILWRDYKSV